MALDRGAAQCRPAWGSMTLTIILTIVGALLGATFSLLLPPVIERVRSKGGELTGEWRQSIPPSQHKSYPRVDRVIIHQNGQRFKAICSREQPAQERDHRWYMRGFLSGNEAVVVFWPFKSNPDGSSFGTMVLHRVPDPQGGQCWDGSYVRPGSPAATPPSGPHPLKWEPY